MFKLFQKYYTIRNFLFFFGESVLILSGIWCAIIFTAQWLPPEQDVVRVHIWLRIVIILAVLQISLYYNDLYDFNKKMAVFDLSMKIVQSIGVACLLLAAIYYLFPELILRQGIFFVGLFILLFVLVSWRYLYQFICKHDLFNDKVLLIGDGPLAHLISHEIRALDSGFTITGVFSNPTSSGLAEELSVQHFSDYSKLCAHAKTTGASSIILSLEERRGKSPIQDLLNCKLQGLKVIEGLSFYELLSGKVLATQAPPSWLIFSEGFRRHKFFVLGKRVLDVGLSLSGIILAFPLMALIAPAIRLSSPGPVFFLQTRVGQREKPYKVVKFRTMKADAEKGDQAVWATAKDPRVTKLGHFLRKFRLDEIPQFWNVLKGEMSFVGPRPERPEFVEQLKARLPYYGERHTVKPGITGWAQVNYPYGASEEDALRKLEYDLFYIKNMSLLLDLYIVLKTVKTVITGEGAR